MFDLKKYLSQKPVLNESLQSSIISKEILDNPANNFNYLAVYRSDGAFSAAEYRLDRFISSGSMYSIVKSSHKADDLNSDKLFKYIPFGKYIYELIHFLSVYVKYKHGLDDVDEKDLMDQHKRYMIIYRQWDKALNKGIFGRDVTPMKALDCFLPKNFANFSDITDSNFKRYTRREAQKLGKDFTAIKNSTVMFFFTNGNYCVRDKTNLIADEIKLPKGGLIGISAGGNEIYDITRSDYTRCRDNVKAMKEYGYKDTYILELKNGNTLEFPYFCGFRNIVPEKEKASNVHNNIKLYRKKWETEIVNDIYKPYFEANFSNYRELMKELKAILEKMDIYDFAYTDFKYSLNDIYDDNLTRSLGSIYNFDTNPVFGGWGEDPNDYVYVLIPDREIQGDKKEFDDWVSTGVHKYTDSLNRKLRYNLDVDNNIGGSKKLSKSEVDFIRRSDTSNSPREKTRHSYIMSKKEEVLKSNNIEKYTIKLEALRNVSKEVTKYIGKIREYKSLLKSVNDKIADEIDFDISSDVKKYGSNVEKSHYRNTYKTQSTKQKTLVSIRSKFIMNLNELCDVALQFSQSNKNFLAGNFRDAALDLEKSFRMQLFEKTGGNVDTVSDEQCSKLPFKEVYSTMKNYMSAKCECIDELINDFNELTN